MSTYEGALQKNDLDGALSACRAAYAHASDVSEGGEQASGALDACGRVEAKRGQWAAAARWFGEAAEKAVHSPAARRKALAMKADALRRAGRAEEVRRVSALMTADQKVESVLAVTKLDGRPKAGSLSATRQASLISDLTAATSVYRRERDEIRAERADALRLLVRSSMNAEVAGRALEDVLRSLAKDPPSFVREVLLEASWRGNLARGDLEGALGAAFELNALRSRRLPEGEGQYFRMPGLDALAERFDRAHGVGSAARLEHDRTGQFSLTDFSKKGPFDELPNSWVEKVHAQVLPAVEGCVLSAARADRDRFRGTDIQVSWVIVPDGTTQNLEIAPRRYMGELSPCISMYVGAARYPTWRSGERRLVSVPYHLE